jgi:hypothetical protein
MAAAIIRRMLDINHRTVVEQRGGGDIHYTSQPIDIRFHVRLPVDTSIDGRR